MPLSICSQDIYSKMWIVWCKGDCKYTFSSYLNNRKQFGSIKTYSSMTRKIIAEVPQGSVLEPLFFPYTHKWPYTQQSNASPIDLAKNIIHDLKKLSQLLNAIKFSLNVGKTKLIIFRPCSKKIDGNIKFKLDGKRLIPWCITWWARS